MSKQDVQINHRSVGKSWLNLVLNLQEYRIGRLIQEINVFSKYTRQAQQDTFIGSGGDGVVGLQLFASGPAL